MVEPVRVLYVIDSLGPGGAETSLASMAPHLARLGVDLHVCYLIERDGLHEQFRSAGAMLHRLDVPRIRRVAALRRLIRQVDPDIVHTTLYEADQVGRVAGALTRRPVVSSLVSTGFELGSWRSVAGLKTRAAVVVDAVTARAVTRFHAVSPPVVDVMSRRLILPRDRFAVIPRGREPDALGAWSGPRRRSVRKTLGLAPGAPFVVAVGREVLPKGHATLLNAIPEVAELMPGIRIAIAGRPGDRSDEITQAIADLDIGHIVDRLGHRDDVADLLVAADVLAFPSTREGFPGTLIEAMAMECPIVASDIPSIRSILERPDGNSLGTMVPVGDSGALARALVAELDSPRDEEQLSRARLVFERDFTTSAVSERTIALYRDVLRRP
ncbi:MAG: glycosyltransferase [Acidimicrobiia bacterium]|nr:glycosyltransferase [Acidimicrobiia bacterium]